MKHIFIVNPAAGAADSCSEVIKRVTENTVLTKNDYLIHMTTSPGDATSFVAGYCDKHPDEKLRFYACGGDGTLNEVASALIGRSNTSLACYSAGSGNDYVKYYGGKNFFNNLEKLIKGNETPIDAMRVNDRFAINATHFGFDTYVAKKMTQIRRTPVIGGGNSYYTGVLCGLAAAMKTKCRVYADEELVNPGGELLLCTLANGKYVGGSFKCAPRSDNNDGLLELCLVHPVSRTTFISLIKGYTAGTHLDDPKFQKHLEYRRCKKVVIEFEKPDGISIDGEILDGDHFEVEILPSALNFVIPEGCVFRNDKEKNKQLLSKK